jgi:hypothetical protein
MRKKYPFNPIKLDFKPIFGKETQHSLNVGAFKHSSSNKHTPTPAASFLAHKRCKNLQIKSKSVLQDFLIEALCLFS